MDSSSLRADSPIRPASPGCSACHPYSLQDPDHFTHLVYNGEVYLKKVNGFISCLDCHRTAMQAAPEIVFDSLYQDSQGTILSTVDSRGAFRQMPGILIRVDTLEHHRPVPLNDNVPQAGALREWVTGLAHMNGKVDVVFDPSVSDTARYQGARAEFNPKLETCSAVSCHLHDGPYRFQACSKGLPELSGGPGPYYQCDGDAASPRR